MAPLSRAPLLLSLLGVAALSSCASEAEPRPQTVVVLDTDLPPSDDDDPAVSQAARVDALLVEVLAPDGTVRQRFEKLAPSRLDWPISFGVVGAARVRARLFRAKHAQRDADGVPSPPAGGTVDRVFDVAAPATYRRVRLMLGGDCLGRKPSFGAGTTCVDAARLEAPTSDGVEELGEETPTTVAGTWSGAREVTCKKSPAPGRVCVPGGVSWLGDERFGGFSDELQMLVDPTPMRLVRLSPFHVDRTEVTVGELRALLAEQPNLLGGAPLPVAKGTGSFAGCTWTETAGDAESFPLVCVLLATAQAVCAARGGTLPSEAQWEHAARGRDGRTYPWGETPPSCCTTAISRTGDLAAVECGLGGLAKVGAFADGDCPTKDVSRDGIVDLAGNARELTRDRLVPYGTGCWTGTHPLLDPVCTDGGTTPAARGASIASARSSAVAVLRHTILADAPLPSTGFRCVYAD